MNRQSLAAQFVNPTASMRVPPQLLSGRTFFSGHSSDSMHLHAQGQNTQYNNPSTLIFFTVSSKLNANKGGSMQVTTEIIPIAAWTNWWNVDSHCHPANNDAPTLRIASSLCMIAMTMSDRAQGAKTYDIRLIIMQPPSTATIITRCWSRGHSHCLWKEVPAGWRTRAHVNAQEFIRRYEFLQ